jgi:hypothetical protein
MEVCAHRDRGAFFALHPAGRAGIARLFRMGDKPTKALTDLLKFSRGVAFGFSGCMPCKINLPPSIRYTSVISGVSCIS